MESSYRLDWNPHPNVMQKIGSIVMQVNSNLRFGSSINTVEYEVNEVFQNCSLIEFHCRIEWRTKRNVFDES